MQHIGVQLNKALTEQNSLSFSQAFQEYHSHVSLDKGSLNFSWSNQCFLRIAYPNIKIVQYLGVKT